MYVINGIRFYFQSSEFVHFKPQLILKRYMSFEPSKNVDTTCLLAFYIFSFKTFSVRREKP